MYVESDSASISAPVLVVVRYKKGVLSWQLPMETQDPDDTKSVVYTAVNRTLCPDDDGQYLGKNGSLDDRDGSLDDKDGSLDDRDGSLDDRDGSLDVSPGSLDDRRITISISTASVVSVQFSVSLYVQPQYVISINESYSTTITPSGKRILTNERRASDNVDQ